MLDGMYMCVNLAIQAHFFLKAPPHILAANNHNEIQVPLAILECEETTPFGARR